MNHANLTLDHATHCALVNGTAVRLTPTEFQILELLVQSAGQVLPYDVFYRTIWSAELRGCDNNLKVNIANIRRKLGGDPLHSYILTVRGTGYQLVVK